MAEAGNEISKRIFGGVIVVVPGVVAYNASHSLRQNAANEAIALVNLADRRAYQERLGKALDCERTLRTTGGMAYDPNTRTAQEMPNLFERSSLALFQAVEGNDSTESSSFNIIPLKNQLKAAVEKCDALPPYYGDFSWNELSSSRSQRIARLAQINGAIDVVANNTHQTLQTPQPKPIELDKLAHDGIDLLNGLIVSSTIFILMFARRHSK